MDYELKRSRRRTVSIEINKDGRLLVRAPMRLPKYEIEKFIEEKKSWIDKHMSRVRIRREKEEQKGEREKIITSVTQNIIQV